MNIFWKENREPNDPGKERASTYILSIAFRVFYSNVIVMSHKILLLTS